MVLNIRAQYILLKLFLVLYFLDTKMRLRSQIIIVLCSFAIGWLYSEYIRLKTPKPLPKFDIHKYWGPGSGENYVEDEDITQSQIRYKAAPIAKLRQELNETLNWHRPLEGVGYEYGVNSDTLLQFIEYWRDDYLVRWLSREVVIDRMPHYVTQVQG